MMRVMLFVHLLGFAMGFGSVLVVDTIGLLWVLRRVTARQLVWLTGIVQAIIWAAVITLVISGASLLPPVISGRTQLKLIAVVVLVVNGIVLDRIRRRLERLKINDFWNLPRAFQLQSVLAISVSQLAWWTAVVIGFLNSLSH